MISESLNLIYNNTASVGMTKVGSAEYKHYASLEGSKCSTQEGLTHRADNSEVPPLYGST